MIAIHIFRNVLWHLIFYADYSNRYIATLTQCSHPVVSTIRSKLTELQLTWLVIKQMSNSELKAVFYPKLTNRQSNKVEPDYTEVLRQKELPRKKQKSLAILSIEYRIQYGNRAYKQTVFYERIRAFLKKNNATMTQFYRPGEVMFIDYLGSKAKYQKNGKVVFIPIFVAWIKNYQHVLLIGPTGKGKTTLACALANEAIKQQVPTLFYRMANLLLELVAAKKENTLDKLTRKINRAPLLISKAVPTIRKKMTLYKACLALEKSLRQPSLATFLNSGM